MPKFGHVSLILAPDRSKLLKRHGATSVRQFKEMGFLSQAMVNYLALLGWNGGIADEIFMLNQFIEKFSIERITKSAAIFDGIKLRWISRRRHLRNLPTHELNKICGEIWKKNGFYTEAQGRFIDVSLTIGYVVPTGL